VCTLNLSVTFGIVSDFCDGVHAVLQRINRLSNNNDFESALTLAGQFYKGTSKAIAGELHPTMFCFICWGVARSGWIKSGTPTKSSS